MFSVLRIRINQSETSGAKPICMVSTSYFGAQGTLARDLGSKRKCGAVIRSVGVKGRVNLQACSILRLPWFMPLMSTADSVHSRDLSSVLLCSGLW